MVTLLAAALATPFLHKPFHGEHRFSGVFDHGRDREQRQLTTWGSWTWGPSGHAAYDWPMPIGTPVLAAADGVVHVAGDAGPTRCGRRRVPHHYRVAIRHKVDGVSYLTSYLHLSEVAVKPNQLIEAGTVVGLSGNSGCSSGPHLHFAVHQRTPEGPLLLDPYGWTGEGADPLEGRRASRWLWLEGEAPLLYKQGGSREQTLGEVRFGPVRPVAWKDDLHPNQEFVELKLKPGSAVRSLEGYRIRGSRGTWAIPTRARVTPRRAYRLYSGSGRSGRRYGYLDQSQGIWDDARDCAILIDPEGEPIHWVAIGRSGEARCRSLLRETKRGRGIR